MATIKSWVQAARLRTLPLAFSGWLVGTTLASNRVEVSGLVAILTLLTAILLQIVSNLANDFGDAVSGVDSEVRKGPSRMVQAGVISKESMKKAVVLSSIVSLIAGCSLLHIVFRNDFVSSLIFLIIGLTGILAAIKYTVGKNPYGYSGFGDLFVFVFFGLVLVFGTYYLQVKSLDWIILLPSASIGLFSVGVLNVNNIRDIESDRATGKHSIPVRMGRENAIIYHKILLVGGMLAACLYASLQFETVWQLIFILLAIPFMKNIQAVAKLPLDKLDPFLKQMALSTLLFAILFSAGNVIASFY